MYSTPSGEEVAPTKKGAQATAENSLRSSVAKNLFLRGEGRPLILAVSSAPNCGGGDGAR